MKKIRIFVLITLLIMPSIVLAESVPCSTVNTAVENYKDIEDEITELKCDTTTEEDVIKECKNKTLEKTNLLSKLMYYNDSTECNNASLTKIVEENEGVCSNVFGSSLSDLTKNIMYVFYIIAPFLLIIFGSLDFSKIVVMNDPKEASVQRRKFFKRLIAFVLLFITPGVVHLISNLNLSRYRLDGDGYYCSFEIDFKPKRWETIYIEKQTSNGGGSGGVYGNKNILDAAEKYHAMMEATDQNWSYYDTDTLYGLYWNNIEKSTYNPKRRTCCATFIGSVLYVSGIFTEEELNSRKVNYNSPESLAAFLKGEGWIKVDKYSDLVAGDIVFMTPTSYGQPGHVQLYAGNGTWYNAGSTESIQRDSPYKGNDSAISAKFMYAYRMP